MRLIEPDAFCLRVHDDLVEMMGKKYEPVDAGAFVQFDSEMFECAGRFKRISDGLIFATLSIPFERRHMTTKLAMRVADAMAMKMIDWFASHPVGHAETKPQSS